jgi:hypothetical protein
VRHRRPQAQSVFNHVELHEKTAMPTARLPELLPARALKAARSARIPAVTITPNGSVLLIVLTGAVFLLWSIGI